MKFVAMLCWCGLLVALTVASLMGGPQEQKEAPKAKDAKPADVTGYWSCSGRDYSGVVMIERIKSTYVVQWTVNGNTSLGVGQLHGDLFVVGWQAPGGKSFGVTVYSVGKGEMAGTYSSLSVEGKSLTLAGPMSETLQFLRKLPAPAKGDI